MASNTQDGRTHKDPPYDAITGNEYADTVEEIMDEPEEVENVLLECGLCDYRTSNGSNLEDHIRGHTGEKPFKCPWSKCYHEYSSENELLRHYDKHRAAYRRRPFDCPVCPLALLKRGDLMKHITEAHRDVPVELAIPPPRYPEGKPRPKEVRPGRWCKWCGIPFNSKSAYWNHQLFHRRGYITYQFEGCGRRYVNGCVLRRHIREQHTEKKKEATAAIHSSPDLPRSYNTRSSCCSNRIDGMKYDASICLMQPKIVLIPPEKQTSDNSPIER